MKIFINPGHCKEYNGNFMKDPGAVNNVYCVTEAEIVYKIGKRLQTYLKNIGIETVFLQSDNLRNNPIDDDLTMPCIVTEANKSGCDYAISIHLNAFWGNSQGTECFVFERESEAEDLAKCIQASIVNSVGTYDRGIKYEEDKESGKRLSFIMKTNMPAVLIECCFIDNNDDVQCVLTDEGVDKMAKAIYDGIMEHIGYEVQNA